MSARMDFTKRLLGALWEDYAKRVPYARVYQNLLADHAAVFVNDHLACRSLGITVDGQDLGLAATCNIFAALGFEEKGTIDLPAEKLIARHLQHEEPDFPRIFASQLKVEELDEESQRLIRETVVGARLALDKENLQALHSLDTTPEPDGLFDTVLKHFRQLPWLPPNEHTLRKVNGASPYGAWVLVHGYCVHHFSGYVNRHGVESLDDIEKLADELKKRGVPVKNEIDGARGSRLRQISTEPVRVPVRVRDGGGSEKEIEWTYACMDYVQRGEFEENGERRLFQGFVGSQGNQLSEAARMK